MPYVEHPFVCLFSILERILEMAVKCHRFCMHCVPFIIYIALPGEQLGYRVRYKRLNGGGDYCGRHGP